jgi:hypothetical protein
MTNGFERWWRAFQSRTRGEDPHRVAGRLRAKLRRTRVAERPVLRQRLWRALLRERHDYGVALFLLASESDHTCLGELAAFLTPLPELQSRDQESHLADIVRLLAATDVAPLLRPVEAYLLRRPIGPHWATVPWALWPHRKHLFARAWQRYLREVRPDHWNSSQVLAAFLAEPEAVRVVRRTVAREQPENWSSLREALIGVADRVEWLSREQRESLDRAVS